MLGTSQSTIARLENREYGKFSLSTLIELAKAFDVALMVEFVTFKDFLIRTRNMSQSALRVDQFSREALDFLCSEDNASLLLIRGGATNMHSDPAATNDSTVTMRRPTPTNDSIEMLLNMDSTPIQQQVA